MKTQLKGQEKKGEIGKIWHCFVPRTISIICGARLSTDNATVEIHKVNCGKCILELDKNQIFTRDDLTNYIRYLSTDPTADPIILESDIAQEKIYQQEKRKETYNEDDLTIKLLALEESRKSIYGDPFLSHQAIGLAWEGVFRNRYHNLGAYLNKPTGLPGIIQIGKPGELFPPDLVAEMLAAFKIVRLARPVFHEDSANDAEVYIEFSKRFRKEK